MCGWQLYTFHLLISGHDRRTEPKFGSHVRIDTLTLKKIKILTHPTPGGFRGLYIVKNLSRRIAPKFGTHVRIDTLTLKKIKILTHPTPGGFRGLYIVNKSFATDRAQIWHACADRYSHIKKYIKKLTHPTPGGFRGLNCLDRLALARERTPSDIKSRYYHSFAKRRRNSAVAAMKMPRLITIIR